jgi:rRNA-processing protein FCF1
MSRTTRDLADKADEAIFAAAEALDRLAEATRDPAVKQAAQEVGGVRRFARAHMTRGQRRETPH